MDGQPVIKPEERQGVGAGPVRAAQSAFDARLVSPISSAGRYRIFVERQDLIFIQIEGGSKSVLAALAPLLGPAGSLIPAGLWLLDRGKTKKRRQKVYEGDPEELLRESNANFKLNLAEIREAAIEPPSFFMTSGRAARFNLLVRHGEKIKCEFETGEEVSNAIHLLEPLLNATLRIDSRWNEAETRFEK